MEADLHAFSIRIFLMKNDNIIDFLAYAEQHSLPQELNNMLSEDLGVAIDILIQRLRSRRPLEQAV
jgi:hypothetical protein